MPDAPIDSLFVSFQQAVAGRYSLVRELGRGGMGVVYLAREVRLDRLVAIKLLPPEHASHAPVRDRFLREARTAARLSHPHLVPIHAVDEMGDFVFFVMAFVDGETLAQRVASRGPLPPNDVTRILREAAWALAYAHAQGVVHRDVKPGNILLERGTERALVADFGIARVAHAGGETAAGELLGTPEYMSPEQASGAEVDGRSDLYSLGAVGYMALTGAPPFLAPSAQGVLAQHLTKPAPAVATVTRGVPRSLARTVDRCLQKDPAARFDSGEALADALATALDRRPEVPIPLRVFLDRRRMLVLIAPPVLVVPLAIDTLLLLARPHSSIVRPSAILALACALALAVPLVVIVRRLRTLLRLGYGPDDIVAALRTRYDRRREEFLFEFGLVPSAREKMFRVARAVGLLLAGVSAVAMFAGVPRTVWGPIMAVSFYFGIIATAVSAKWSRLRNGTGSAWAGFWRGRASRALTRLAEFRLGTRAVASDQPTEMAIAMSAEALFSALPKPLRESLGDLPQALSSLRAHARTARARIEELDAALAEASRGPAQTSAERQHALEDDLRAARAAAESRLGELVTGLENLRLDLLRLRAGGDSVEGITADIASAKEFGEATDRLLAGAREVDDALKAPRPRG